MKLLEDPNPVPEGMSAIEDNSNPLPSNPTNSKAFLIMGCSILLASSTLSILEYLTINPHSFGHDFLNFIAAELQADRDESNPSDLLFREWSSDYTRKYATDVKKFHELWPELDALIMKEKKYEMA